MAQYNICDIHGHFLPELDDGSKSVSMSVEMLKMSREQGITRMFATPHYYPVESVSAFLSRRDRAEAALRDALAADGGSFPEFCVGAEVAYRPGIGYEQDLEKLCLGHSGYLLLELPFSRWGKEVARDIANMTSTRGVIPILAHLERYRQDRQILSAILEQDVLVQMNAEYLLDWKTRGVGKKLLRAGRVQLLGSDCHRTERRAPNLGQAVQWLEKAGLDRQLSRLAALSNEIFEEATR